MPPKSVELPRFGGLDLRDDPQEVSLGAATDALNVEYDARGRLRSRDGYAKFTAATHANRVLNLFPFYRTNGSVSLLAATSGSFSAYDTSGAVIASSGAITATAASFARLGTPASERVYAASWNEPLVTANTVQRWDGSAWTATAFTGLFVATQGSDNRLLVAGADLTSRINFSDAGVPETFGANNFVRVTPGDGEMITNMVAWGNDVFVFKNTKFFVFYGTDVDGSGNPIFNYRTVESGVGCDALQGAVATNRGVFFVNRRGIYLTTGGQPVKITERVDGIFSGSLSAYFQGSALNQAKVSIGALSWSNERLYFSYASGSATVNDRMLVWDSLTDTWTLFDLPVAGMCPFRVSSATGLMFAYSSGANEIGRHSSAYTTDAGVAITSRYRTGFWNPGTEGAEAWIREVLLDGVGTVTVKTAVNDAATLGSGQAVTLGTSPAVAQGRDRRGARGRNVSYEFSGTAPWSLSRVTPIMWGQSAIGMKAA